MRRKLIEFSFIIGTPFLSISKDSAVKVGDEFYQVKKIDKVILLNESVGYEGSAKIEARGYKLD